MDFIDEVRLFSSRAQSMLVHLKTEEATKHSLVLPFLQMLGFNVFDPSEVVPEFHADVGTKKGEKVDYAIMLNGKPVILIEAKTCTDQLNGHDSQLFRYFSATESKFAILTNGIIYKFYSDLQEPNKMDLEPFWEFNLFDPKEAVVAELKKFQKVNFNTDDLVSAAANLKYTTKIKSLLEAELREPSDDFARFWLKDAYAGKVTASVLERLKPIVKKALNQYISELIGEKLKSAIETTMEPEKQVAASVEAVPVPATTDGDDKPRIVTTTEEIEGFYVVKAILRDVVDPARITYKDTASYLGIMLDGNVRKWICRLYLNGGKKYLAWQAEGKEEKSARIDCIDDMFKYKDELLKTVTMLTKQPATPAE